MTRELDQINFKCPIGLIRLMKEDIEETEEFRNQSEYLVAALRYFITERQKTKIALQKNSEEDFIASSGSLQSDQDIKTK